MECFLFRTFSCLRPMTQHCSFLTGLNGLAPSEFCSFFLTSLACQVPGTSSSSFFFFPLYLYLLSLSNPSHNLKQHLHVDDSQVYVPAPNGSPMFWIICLAAYLILSSMGLPNRSLKRTVSKGQLSSSLLIISCLLSTTLPCPSSSSLHFLYPGK